MHGMSDHDWIAIALSVVASIVVPALGLAFVSRMKALEAQFQEAIKDMEERVVTFIRRHEQDGFAHPNLEVVKLITAKLEAIERSISALTLMIEKHIAREEK